MTKAGEAELGAAAVPRAIAVGIKEPLAVAEYAHSRTGGRRGFGNRFGVQKIVHHAAELSIGSGGGNTDTTDSFASIGYRAQEGQTLITGHQCLSVVEPHVIFIEKFKLGALNLDIREDQAEGAGRGCGTGARQKETHVCDITVNCSEQPLGRERLEIAWEAKQWRGNQSCVRADQETGAGRTEYDTARRVDVKEIAGQCVGVGKDIRDTVPVDFATQSAERTVCSRDCTSAYGVTEEVASRRNRGGVSTERLVGHETAMGGRNRKHQRSCKHSFEQHHSILYSVDLGKFPCLGCGFMPILS